MRHDIKDDDFSHQEEASDGRNPPPNEEEPKFKCIFRSSIKGN